MEITFLGTGSMVPTVQRNHCSFLLAYRDEAILFDCGEGTQRQLRKAKVSPAKITKILITHWHGDHVLGLPGLVQTMAACEYSGTLEIYGPVGSQAFFDRMFSSFVLDARIKVRVIEVKQGVFFENEFFSLEAAPARHSAYCVAYAFTEKDRRRINTDYLKKFGLQQHPILKELQNGRDITWKGSAIKADDATFVVKGKKIAYITDTLLCSSLVGIAQNADLLVCEATLADDMKDKAAISKHMTSSQAASIARDANVTKLVLTHFSPRYKSVAQILREAKKIFRNTSCAKDFMRISL
ncbi:MAG TPA: ribonuclease Z [Nanoarchaeota archaeon]|nr:ribonuclease Z [Nanoarchaeota archaeon]